MSSLTIERAGIAATVVDRGRFGYRDEGIAWCGPADRLAYDVANALVLNDAGAALLEIAYGDARIHFADARAFALTGADCEAELDGRRCAAWSTHVAQPGALLVLRVPKHGVFSYLSVSGGIDVPLVLGSRTTDRAGGFGGYHGRALRAGDRLPLGAAAAVFRAPFTVAPPQRREVIRAIVAPECAAGTRQHFFGAEWRVGMHADRMGYRLCGSRLSFDGPAPASHAVFPGVVQVPPSGEPIVLLADAHTTGGYPKVAIVLDVDLRLIAQTRPGETLRFTLAQAEDAIPADAARRAYVQAIRARAVEQAG